jgi:hypothetical protein
MTTAPAAVFKIPRKHAHTQRRLCERFAAPVIGAVTCEDIKTGHTQKIVNAAPTAGEGGRVHGMLSALVAAGIEGGYLANPRLAMVWRVDQAARVITVDRKVIEVAGHLYTEAPKCRKYRKTIYPRRTPDGYPLAEKLAARIEQATAEHEAGTNPLGLIFPSPAGKHWRSSNFNRNVLKRAHLAIGWRDGGGVLGRLPGSASPGDDPPDPREGMTGTRAASTPGSTRSGGRCWPRR